MKNQFKKLLLLSSGLISTLFVAGQCSSTPENNNLTTSDTGQNGKQKEDKLVGTNDKTTEDSKQQTDIRTSPESEETEINLNVIDEGLAINPFPTEKNQNGDIVKFSRVAWNLNKSKKDFVRELKKVSADYKVKIKDTAQLKLLRSFYIRDTNDISYKGTPDNLAVTLHVPRFVVKKEDQDKPKPPSTLTSYTISVPFNWIPKDQKTEKDLDGKLSVTQKNAKKGLLELREQTIKNLFMKFPATFGQPAHYDLKLLNKATPAKYQTLLYSVSALILTIDYLLKNHIFDSHINQLLRGVQILDESGNPSNELTERFFATQFKAYPASDNLGGYAFAFTYLYLVQKNAALVNFENKNS
ncbi:Uncharacterised protein [Mycoplasmopsis citelli]|uniref:Lipoprotein n=1 Tax=Mycoplasmopsis citelli TaxID=171281 RepID=A0A449B2Q6_9BACT|nr:hypothetical protein [Mycoplasmopsis citelli]VEU74887.1 Uncharacterised protein [Mycoplasmopsis citelli]